MSELAKSSRAAMKDKIKRMLGPNSGGDIDASGWREPTDMNANAQTGLRPVSRQARRHGGKVDGHAPHARADRKPRKSGGRAIADDYQTRNAKDANASEFGKPHDGGYARGGMANFRKQMHADVAEDKRLSKHMKGADRPHKRNGGGQFIQRAIKHPGALHEELHVPKGKKIPAKKLAKAAHSDNPKLAKRAKFAEELKGFRHGKAGGGGLSDVLAEQQAANAGRHAGMQARAAMARPAPTSAPVVDTGGGNDGGTSGGDMNRGGRTRKAHGGSLNAEIGARPKGGRDARKHGGRAKGKTNIVIAINPGHGQQPQMPMPSAPVRPPVQSIPTPPPMPPQMPPGGGMPMAGLGAAGPQMPMPRKSGGRTMPTVGSAKRARSYKDMEAASGSGLGRMEKTAIQERR